MAKQLINLGTTVNDGTGDTLRLGAEKINENFTELYNFLSNDSGKLSYVSSITADTGIRVSSTSGNVVISLLPATPDYLGAIKVGEGLQISPSGVLSTVTPPGLTGSYNDLTDKPDLSVYQLASTAFRGSYDDLTSKPDLSVYQLVSTAFSGSYNDLTDVPDIPTSLFDLGIDRGLPGQVLTDNGTGSAEFSDLFDQSLNTFNNVLFANVTSNTLTLNANVAETEALIVSLTGQREMFNQQLSSLQLQQQTAQTNLSYWQGQLSQSQPGSPQWNNAYSMYSMYMAQYQQLSSQIAIVQGNISSISGQINYYQSISNITSLSVQVDHPTLSFVFEGSLTASKLNLPESCNISASETGLSVVSTGITSVSSADDVTVSVAGKTWTFDNTGILKLPAAGDIVNSSGVSIIPEVSDQTTNTTDDVEFNKVTANIFASTTPGVSTITSATNINLTAAGTVVITSSPIRIASLTTDQRRNIIKLDGDVFYNSSIKRFQVIQDNKIRTLKTCEMTEITAGGSTLDLSNCGVFSNISSWSQDSEDGHTSIFYGTEYLNPPTVGSEIWFGFDPTKFSGGVIEFEADEVETTLTDVTLFNRYYGSVRCGHFNDGTTDHFTLESSVKDTLNEQAYNFASTIARVTLPSTKGGISGIGIGIRRLIQIPGRSQVNIKWKATMFTAKVDQVLIYSAGVIVG